MVVPAILTAHSRENLQRLLCSVCELVVYTTVGFPCPHVLYPCYMLQMDAHMVSDLKMCLDT